MADREAWPGAGFYFDLKNIKYSDFELIEQHAKTLPDTQTSIRFYERASEEIHHASGMRDIDYGAASFDAIEVYKGCKSAIRLQKKVAEHEAASQPAEEIEDPTDSGKFTSARRVMAVYYLLLAAGASPDMNRAELGRFAHFLGVKSKANAEKYAKNPIGKQDSASSSKDAAFVRAFFEELGAEKALDLLNKDFTKSG